LYSNGKLLYKEIPEVKKQLEKVRDYILKYQTEKNEMKEIVIVSGKGGTGKTSITASFAYLGNKDVIVADCDVDAADMHLLLKPDFGNPKDFYSGLLAKIDQEKYLKSFIIIPDYIDLKSLDTTDFDMLIASICSRVSLDERQLFSKPILTVPEAIEFIQTNKINESDFKFDQFN